MPGALQGLQATPCHKPASLRTAPQITTQNSTDTKLLVRSFLINHYNYNTDVCALNQGTSVPLMDLCDWGVMLLHPLCTNYQQKLTVLKHEGVWFVDDDESEHALACGPAVHHQKGVCSGMPCSITPQRAAHLLYVLPASRKPPLPARMLQTAPHAMKRPAKCRRVSRCSGACQPLKSHYTPVMNTGWRSRMRDQHEMSASSSRHCKSHARPRQAKAAAESAAWVRAARLLPCFQHAQINTACLPGLGHCYDLPWHPR